MATEVCVATTERISGLKRRDSRHLAAGFLVQSETVRYRCTRCERDILITKTQLGQFVMQGTEEAPYRFECEGCGLEVRLPVTIEEIPSWSCNLEIVLGPRVTEKFL